MHTVLHHTVSSLLALSRLTAWLSTLFAAIAHRPAGKGDYLMAAIVVSSVLIALVCGAGLLAYRHFANRAYRRLERSLVHAQAEIRFREAMLASSPDAIVILGASLADNCSYGGGAALLQQSLDGPDAAVLASAMNALIERGTSFRQRVRTNSNGQVTLSGRVVGSRAVVFLRKAEAGEAQTLDFRALLDSLPFPVWLRDRHLALAWANKAFLATTGAKDLEHALASNAAFERSERDLADAACKGATISNVKRPVISGNRRRIYSLSLSRQSDTGIAGAAIDITESSQTETALRQQNDAVNEILDRLPIALAIFGADRHLTTSNAAFARLWKLPKEWLETGPVADEILDRLRAGRHLAERPDFSGWKRGRLSIFEHDGKPLDELWHLPGGRSVHFTAQPHLAGGVFWTFEDISEQLKSEAEAAMLAQVQRATLNTIDDGMAVFGADGKLKLHNDSFARLWQFGENELAGGPHLRKIAELATERLGHDSAWNIVSAGINSGEPERYAEWSRILRGDGRIISLAMARLPNGATLVTFRDLTDVERFEHFLRSSGTSGSSVA